MDPQNALENATLAMKRAEEWLGVPQVGEGMGCVYVININAFGSFLLLTKAQCCT